MSLSVSFCVSGSRVLFQRVAHTCDICTQGANLCVLLNLLLHKCFLHSFYTEKVSLELAQPLLRVIESKRHQVTVGFNIQQKLVSILRLPISAMQSSITSRPGTSTKGQSTSFGITLVTALLGTVPVPHRHLPSFLSMQTDGIAQDREREAREVAECISEMLGECVWLLDELYTLQRASLRARLRCPSLQMCWLAVAQSMHLRYVFTMMNAGNLLALAAKGHLKVKTIWKDNLKMESGTHFYILHSIAVTNELGDT